MFGKPRRHRSARHQKHRQMAEAERTDQQPGDDLVADPEEGCGVEHAVAERNRSAHCDDISAEQRQVHARLSLRHSVAHRRNCARDLCGCCDLPSENLHLLWISAVRLMRGEHVIEGRDYPDIRSGKIADRVLVFSGRREAVREIAAGQPWAAHAPLLLLGDQVEITPAARLGSFDDAVGDR